MTSKQVAERSQTGDRAEARPRRDQAESKAAAATMSVKNWSAWRLAGAAAGAAAAAAAAGDDAQGRVCEALKGRAVCKRERPALCVLRARAPWRPLRERALVTGGSGGDGGDECDHQLQRLARARAHFLFKLISAHAFRTC